MILICKSICFVLVWSWSSCQCETSPVCRCGERCWTCASLHWLRQRGAILFHAWFFDERWSPSTRACSSLALWPQLESNHRLWKKVVGGVEWFVLKLNWYFFVENSFFFRDYLAGRVPKPPAMPEQPTPQQRRPSVPLRSARCPTKRPTCAASQGGPPSKRQSKSGDDDDLSLTESEEQTVLVMIGSLASLHCNLKRYFIATPRLSHNSISQ